MSKGKNNMDNIQFVFEKLDVDIRYPNIYADMDINMILYFNSSRAK